MDVSLVHQCSKMEESSGPKPKELERASDILPNGRCTTLVQMENATAEDVEKASAELKVKEYVSVGAKIVRPAEDSTKFLSFGELPQDSKLCSPGQMELQTESPTTILSSPKHVTQDHNHEFGSQTVNSEAVQENHVTATESTDNGPIKELEQLRDIVPNGRCTTPVHIENATAEDVQKASAGKKVEEYVSVSDTIVQSADDSTKLLPFGELPHMKFCSHGPMELKAESPIGILSSSKQVTLDHNHELGSEMINNEALQENHVIAAENTDTVPIKDQKSEFEQKGTIQEEVTQNFCLESTSQIENLPRKFSGCQLGLPTGDAAKDCKHVHLGQRIDDATNTAGLEQLGHGQMTAANIPSQLGDTKKGSRSQLRKGQNSMTSSGGTVKVLPEKRKNTRESSVNSSRSLRSRSQEKSKAPELSNIGTKEGAESAEREKKRKKRKKRMEKNIDEFSKIRKHLRYLLHRINYEKNFIDAYSGEGWKGQSLEKIKPEKELQRAKSEILQRKLKIRDLFQRLDLSCTEGRLPETLFDSEGEIDSEDIFCAKCGSTDVTLSNDIILCDGACERGFHQFCLDPPLLKEHIPSNDEGWLCPGCDCKVDCIELLNDSQGTDISVSDSWEKVFAVEAAAVAAGKNLDDISGLPSDDSEDEDYDPDGPNLDKKVQGDVSSSDEPDYHSASDDLRVLPQKEPFLGLPSDDSEDDDYDPSGFDSDQKSRKESSSSDFTSDSEDFTVVLDDCKPSSEVQGPPTSSPDHVRSNEEVCGSPWQGDPASLYPRRQVKRLDYKKLHDEEYGNTSSDSSDEDYMDIASPNRKEYNSAKEASVLPHLENLTTEHGKETGYLELNLKTSESTHNTRRYSKKLDDEGTNSTLTRSPKGSSATSNRSPSKSSFGEHAKQRLLHSFKENQYPQRAVKESLATELALSVQQVSKWFENARHSFRHSSHRASDVAEFASDKGTPRQKSINLSGSDSKSVLDNATCSEVEKKERDKGSPGVTKCCDRDMKLNKVVEEGNGHNPRITRTGKRKAKVSSEATEPDTSLETPKQKAKVGSEVEKKERDKGSLDVTECCDRDTKLNKVAEEGNVHNPRITRSGKGKAKVGSEATEPNTCLETPKQKAKVNSPKTQGVRKSSRIQSKSMNSTS